MPMSKSFENRLLPVLDEIVDHFGTPFHIYDEAGIRETGQNFINAFSRLNGFREYFAERIQGIFCRQGPAQSAHPPTHARFRIRV
jgi:hypothetical protein